jgi:hypothetical protein
MSLQSTGPSRDERRVDGLDGLDCVRSLKQTCLLLGVSMSTLKRRIDDGSIKTIRLSARRVGIRDSDREAFLQQNAT